MDKEVLPESDLLELARQLDPNALAVIYDTYSPGLYRYAMRRLGDECLAEDCVADTFSRFLQAQRQSRGPARYLQAYLYRIAHNWIIDHYRKKDSQPQELTGERRDDHAGPEEQTCLHLRQERLRAALYRLTPDQQQVIALKFLEGWGNEEIARSLNRPPGAVKSLQHRALAALQRILEGEDLI